MLKKFTIPILIALVIVLILALLGKWTWILWGVILLHPLMHVFGHNHSGSHSHAQNKDTHHHH